MAIRKSDKVLLNGSKKGYGGFITRASYSVGFGSSITQASLTFVSEDGKYTITKDSLQANNTDKISLGAKVLSMVPVEFNIESGSNGKVLTVIYYDKSFLHLDKKIIALKGKHFDNSSQSIIALGQKYYKIEEKNKESILLNRSTSTNDVRQVGEYLYTFDELIDNITIPVSGLDTIKERAKRGGNPIYKETVGTLRSVLSSWGNILGFTFYYSESGVLTFVDLTQGVQPIFPSDVSFVSKTENFSLKNTVSVGSTVYYSKAGETHGPDGTGGGGISIGPADDGGTDYGEFELDNDTSLTLYRPNKTPDDEFDNAGFAIQLGKAAAIGPEFFQFASLYLCKSNPAKYSDVFGYTNVETLPENFKEAFEKPSENFFDNYHIIRYRTDGNVIATIDTCRSAFARFLTYENNLSERTWFLYNWAIGADLKYDIRDETEFLNPRRRSGFGSDSDGAEANHRVYATVPFEEAFDVFESVLNMDLHKSVIPLQLSTAARKKANENESFDPNLYFAAVQKNINFTAIFDRVRFLYANRSSIRIEGRFIDQSGRGGDGSGGGNNSFTTSAVEATRSKEPDYGSNTIRSLVNFDTADHNEAALANLVLPDTNIKFSSTEDSVGEYGLTGNLDDYPLVSYTIETPDLQKTFVVKNIDIEGYQATIAKGLQKMDISIQPDGVTTTYTIGNRNFVLPGDEILIGPRGYVFGDSIGNQKMKPSFAAIKTSLSSTTSNPGGTVGSIKTSLGN
jgi:hypothetical protein